MEKEELDETGQIKKDIRKEHSEVVKKKYSKTILISISCLFGFILLFSVFLFFVVPILNLNGDSVISVEVGTEYIEKSVKATYRGQDVSDEVLISDDIDINKLGEYKVHYSLDKGIIKVKKYRTVKVIDTIPPDITLTGEKEVKICKNVSYNEEGYKAVDKYDGDLSDKVIVKVNDDKITYSISDSSGNKNEVIRLLDRTDSIKPMIRLEGVKNIYIELGSKYIEPGFSATDNCDGNIKDRVIVTDTINVNVPGKYNVSYKVIDSSSNEETVTREVMVMEKKASIPNLPIKKGVIYLTFDDGPSATITPKVLDILKEKEIKATFFVINKSESLDYLIKRAYDEGHAIALHSATHNYSKIYQSQEAYFNDLQTISDKVERITGERSMIIRFPGGSSNTVSRNYSIGIMSLLTNDVLRRGYHYFDWNISSGDAGGSNTKEQVYYSVTKDLGKNKANIVLMHDFENNYKTLNALSDIIDYGKQNGYTFSAIDMTTALFVHSVNN